MWRGESCANGCLSGWKFIPGTQETGKQKTRKNEQLILFGLTQLQKPRENKKKVSTYGEGLRGSWTGDMGWNCLFFVFFHRFWCIFGSRWQKPRENKKTQKVSTHGEGLRGSWTGDMGWNCLFLLVCPWFWTSFCLFQNLDCLYESLW